MVAANVRRKQHHNDGHADCAGVRRHRLAYHHRDIAAGGSSDGASFQVNAPALTVASVNPSRVPVAGSSTVTVTARGFIPGDDGERQWSLASPRSASRPVLPVCRRTASAQTTLTIWAERGGDAKPRHPHHHVGDR